ncbi:50S ribosomal protein L32 [Candidatus Azambacteria bacterium]|nr:50S ribosomal protein L32 [Candidatus Azambacteria bacterium]
MGLPVKRHTSSKRKRRRSHLAIQECNLVKCSHCGNQALSHRVCGQCGYYKGIQIIDVFTKLDKKEKKKKEKELAMQGKKVALEEKESAINEKEIEKNTKEISQERKKTNDLLKNKKKS